MVRALVTVCTDYWNRSPDRKVKGAHGNRRAGDGPLAAFSAKPAGKDPPVMDQVYGVMPRWPSMLLHKQVLRAVGQGVVAIVRPLGAAMNLRRSSCSDCSTLNVHHQSRC